MDAIRDLDISKYRTSADSPYLDPTHSIHFFCWIFETTARGVALGTPLGSEKMKSMISNLCGTVIVIFSLKYPPKVLT